MREQQHTSTVLRKDEIEAAIRRYLRARDPRQARGAIVLDFDGFIARWEAPVESNYDDEPSAA